MIGQGRGRRGSGPATYAARLVLVCMGAVAALAGCAQIPTDGPVHPGREVGYDDRGNYVRPLPADPRPGMTPVEVVKGFLQASAGMDGDWATARRFLVPGLRERWDPEAGVTVYADDQEFALTETRKGGVAMSATGIATINDEGVYNRTEPGSKLEVQFQVAKVDGEWRISDVPPGIYLTEYEVIRSYRAVNLYFLDPRQRVLVPDPIWVPQSPGLSTTLVRRLLRGPSGWLRPGVTTAFPTGTALSGSAPVENGVAHVDLSDVALSAPPQAREAMSAQLVWTLSQLGDVRAVRITVKGTPLTVRGAGEVQPRDAWPGFDPAALSANALPVVVRGGRLGTLDDGKFAAVPGPLGAGKVAPNHPAVSPVGDLVATLSVDGTTLLTGALGGKGAELQAQLRGVALTPPSWDQTSAVWTADRGKSEPVLWMLPNGQAPERVDLPPALGGQRVLNVRVARDGTRIALVTQAPRETRTYVGTVVRGQGGTRVEGLRRLAPEVVDVTDVGWAESTQLAVLGRRGEESPTVYLLDLDGNNVDAEPVQPGAASLAAAPHPHPIMLATDDGALYRLSGRRWLPAGDGAMPAYPG